MELGTVLAQLRNQKGLNQREFAQAIGVSNGAVAMWETNKRQPDLEMIKKIAVYYGVSTDYLLGESDHREYATFYNAIECGGYDNTISHWISLTGYGDDEIAEKLGISINLLHDFISCKVAIPYHILVLLSEICEVSTDCLIGMNNKSREADLDGKLPFQYDYSIAQRIEELRDPIVDTDAFLCMLLSITEKELYYLLEYGFVPHMDTIIKLADYFNVSTDYLLCRVNEQDEKALCSFRQLNEDNKDIIVGEIKKCLKEQRYEESVAAEDSPLRKASGK